MPEPRKIDTPPCTCPECVPGPGIEYKHKRTLSDAMKEAGVDNVERRYCAACRNVVWVISTDMNTHWACICEPHGHTWTVLGIN